MKHSNLLLMVYPTVDYICRGTSPSFALLAVNIDELLKIHLLYLVNTKLIGKAK